ncbi:hypothetical protein [Bradyrhizobium tropiciagri]|uniref:hypothetical protein n=1 Tax=Bradyrhizobium tropiciagri TaxID=312253 RepID=UPI001009E8DE|nr:hypothetical protein [Bradyrhizobium tropiciagri]
MRLPHPRSFVCTTLGERKTFLLATTSRGIGHATGKPRSEEGRRMFTFTRHPFGGGRCRWDSETDNHVRVNPSIRRTVRRATVKIAERLAGAPLHLLSRDAGISSSTPDRTRPMPLMASFESWMRLLHVNLPGLTHLPQDLFPEFKAASVMIVDMA